MMKKNTLELSLRSIILAILLAAVLAVANTYLALKIGILTSASIPAAIIAMGILRFFKHPSILENNLIQTAASAGEAVAGGIVYTIPALIIIGFWHRFAYWENVWIALSSGILGVLLSVPLRSVLVSQADLPFPEARAITAVLQAGAARVVSLTSLIIGSVVGATIEFAQTGLKILANSWQIWWMNQKILVGFSVGFAPSLLGAGYLIGFDLTASIMLGAVFAWLIALPSLAFFDSDLTSYHAAWQAMTVLWDSQLRYIGIGAMLTAGLWTFVYLAKPFFANLARLRHKGGHFWRVHALPAHERDIPMGFIVLALMVLTVAMASLFYFQLPYISGAQHHWMVVGVSVFYVLVMGALACAVTAYFSGLVGVSASPGSSIIIAAILFMGLLLLLLCHILPAWGSANTQALHGEVITIFVGALITGAACIANDNTQDLKVGHLIGASPWRQQLMLLLGVVVAAFVIPAAMQLLFNAYGIAGVTPRAGMATMESLPAPPAALMAAIAHGIFSHGLPWLMLAYGVASILSIVLINVWLKKKYCMQLSVLGFAIGMYLPLNASTPLFIGGLLAKCCQHTLKKQSHDRDETSVARARYRATLLACGLLAGSAIMDVWLAIPLSLSHNPLALSLNHAAWLPYTDVMGMVVTLLILWGFHRWVCHGK